MQVIANPRFPDTPTICNDRIRSRGEYVRCDRAPGHDPADGHEGRRSDGARVRWSDEP